MVSLRDFFPRHVWDALIRKHEQIILSKLVRLLEGNASGIDETSSAGNLPLSVMEGPTHPRNTEIASLFVLSVLDSGTLERECGSPI